MNPKENTIMKMRFMPHCHRHGGACRFPWRRRNGHAAILSRLYVAISLMNAYNRMAISFRNTPQAALAKASS
jgi:hypothetical protein